MALLAHAEPRKLGWVYGARLEVVLREADPAVVVQPDVLYVARGGSAKLTPAWVAGPPDLVVEVLSPNHAHMDTILKPTLYERFGVKELWMVSLALERVEIFRHDGNAFTPPEVLESPNVLTSDQLPGFRLPLPELFAPED